MARPMILIKKELLELLWYKHTEGVPISKLIAIHKLTITPPTLTKLIMYVQLVKDSPSKEVTNIIKCSLFPAWLMEATEDVTKQSSEWRYEGKMPLGEWVHNDWYKGEEND